MAPPRAPLAQSESKARLFERLGLQENDECHRRLYAKMKEEAVEGRKRLTEDQSSLLVKLRDSRIEPPYSHAHVSESAIYQEILRIYQLAQADTRAVYDLGRDADASEDENWVIRWLLWHVFRYRDNRNRHRRGQAKGKGGDVSGNEKSPETETETETEQKPATTSASDSSYAPGRYWDPVRNG